MLAERLRNRRTYMVAIALAVIVTLATSFAVSRGGSGADDGESGGDHGMAGMEQPGAADGAAMDQLSGDDFDRAFLENMIMHHAIAVAMTRPVAARTDRPELKLMADAIIEVHLREIAQMRGWMKEWYGVDVPDPLADEQALYSGSAAMGHAVSQRVLIPGSVADAGPEAPPLPMGGMSMLGDLWRLRPPRLEAVYMSMMIPHHQAAVEMTQLAQDRARRAEVKELATAINRLQTREILQMQRWLGQWFGL